MSIFPKNPVVTTGDYKKDLSWRWDVVRVERQMYCCTCYKKEECKRRGSDCYICQDWEGDPKDYQAPGISC